MANPGSILGQIGESFEQIGQDVVRETVQTPKDVVGKALESLGVTGGKKGAGQKQQAKQPQTPEEGGQQAPPEPGPSEEVKRAIARAALEELSGKKQQKEPTVWEKIQQEEEQKKEMKKKQKDEERKQTLPQVSSKRKRGDLYGTKAKKTQVENRNVRQD